MYMKFFVVILIYPFNVFVMKSKRDAYRTSE
jgi:hypothetical protein